MKPLPLAVVLAQCLALILMVPRATAQRPPAEASSDSNGLFDLSVPRDSAGLLVHKAGYAYSWKFCSPSHSSPVVVRLTPAFTVGGVVTNETGAPVTDAEVWVKLRSR
jgi:hypothetical protein